MVQLTLLNVLNTGTFVDSIFLIYNLIHTFQEIQKDQTHIRLISARKANKIEKKQYLGESS